MNRRHTIAPASIPGVLTAMVEAAIERGAAFDFPFADAEQAARISELAEAAAYVRGYEAGWRITFDDQHPANQDATGGVLCIWMVGFNTEKEL